MSMKQLKFKRLDPTAILPTRGSQHAAGLDLYSPSGTVTLSEGTVTTINTALSVEIPRGFYGRIAPRSGLALQGIDVLAGVIDSDYRGEIKVVLAMHQKGGILQISGGDRIAQLIIEKIETPEAVWDEELEESARGVGGFGSTGV